MKTTFIATGDSFITRHIAEGGYEGYDKVKELLASHDVRFANLEQTFHNQEGYPAAASGGTWAMTEPEKLDDMKAFGFNIFNTANNHSGDYGQGGIVATIKHLKEHGMLFAGTGMTLQEASRPCYLETKEARVAMIGVTTSFDPAARAGAHSGEVIGRPGLNPLRHSTIYHVNQAHFDMVKELARVTLVNWPMEQKIECGYLPPFSPGSLPFGKMKFVLDDNEFIETVPHAGDMERIVEEIKEARRQADIVLVSLHVHEMTGKDTTQAAQFHETFAHACIDAGASVVIGHGPHELRGIEIYKGGAIFYSLGNFIFETETTLLQPHDAYKEQHLPTDMKVGAYMDNRSRNNTIGFPVMPNIWRAVMAGWTIEDGRLTQVQLYPIDLAMNAPRSQRGLPRLLGDEDTLRYLQNLSDRYNTKISIEGGVGTICL